MGLFEALEVLSTKTALVTGDVVVCGTVAEVTARDVVVSKHTGFGQSSQPSGHPISHGQSENWIQILPRHRIQELHLLDLYFIYLECILSRPDCKR